MKWTRPALPLAAALPLLALAPVAAARFDPLPSRVYEWDSLTEQTTAVGARRSVLRGETAALRELEAHVTTILPGNEPHPPHRHANEEMIIVLRGTLAVTIEGETQEAGPGSAVFLAPNDFHGLRNVGDEPASYYVLQMQPR